MGSIKKLVKSAIKDNNIEGDPLEDGVAVSVINAGVSGDTTAGGLARLDWSLADNPDVAIIVLGGNDLLRGLDPDATYRNLEAIIDHALL